MSDVLIEKRHGVGVITLNRPQALNAINLEMVRTMFTTLKLWEQDEDVKAVLVRGAGERAFCAGGDIRTVYESLVDGRSDHMTFFAEEFELNQYIYQYPKPYIALMTGYVMGGGMGISQGASFRVVTPRSKISMPEVGIGYFPDVGGSYFLSRCPNTLGLYLGITGVIASGEDAVYANLADWVLADEQVDDFVLGLETLFGNLVSPSSVSSYEILNQYLKQCNAREKSSNSHLEKTEGMIAKHFSHLTIQEIISSLESEGDPAFLEWVEKTLGKMRKQSPLSMVTTQRLVQLGRTKSMEECFEMEYALLGEWMVHGDFIEGVRALIIDKDNQPKWRYTLDQVSTERVNNLFVKVKQS
ncbi:enoyl-CoA hydratase/isomerase family protein [Polynucleobacter kasalickyi]|uniref:3-hydroxyisobutyryl-CoA hydrolase n=1 Tax=Polynucleobacter kasalickyi TaxID=1938817 RepID=A0A1W1YAI1_9BURK|nr:enoyl-CoA hydratase/isomerase family protein [Polynucleobacter kasalickyi]SMC33182.1 Enoyl-CoA hydratase/carnithine racemase [Polynucleobacter kasalickyi]